MGEIHKASLDGLKLEGGTKDWAYCFAILFGFWFTVYVAFQQKDEKLKSAILKCAVCQWLACHLCGFGWFWSRRWALAAKKQS